MCRYPDRLRDSLRHHLRLTPIGTIVESGQAARLYLVDVARRAHGGLLRLGVRVRHVQRRLERAVTGRTFTAPPLARDRIHIWIDGTSLGREQADYFNLLTELIRRLSPIATRRRSRCTSSRRRQDVPRW